MNQPRPGRAMLMLGALSALVGGMGFSADEVSGPRRREPADPPRYPPNFRCQPLPPSAPPRDPTEAEVAAQAKRERRAAKAKRDAERREAGRR